MQKRLLYLVLAVSLLAACQNKTQPTSNGHGHAHDDVSIQITEYNSYFELFAEADPMVKGKTGGVLAHITYLENFKPLTKGKVTASLVIGKKGIRQTLETPTRPGIYWFKLQPEVTGKGRLLIDIETEEGTSRIVAKNIEVFANEHDAIHAAEAGGNSPANAVVFTKEASWKVDFKTGLPEVGPFGEIIKTTARVQSSQNDEEIIVAKASGIVNFKSDDFAEGSEIKKGEKLFYISSETLAENNLRVRLKEAKTNFEKAEAEYKRKSELAKKQLVSKKDLLSAKAEYENAQTNYKTLRKNFSGGGQNVSSNKAGFVKHIYVSNGEFVEAGQPLVSVTQNKNLFLKAEVQQRYAASLPYVKQANFRTSTGNKIYSLAELNGKIVSYGKSVSDESFLVPITLQIEKRDDILPGSFMELFLKSETQKQAITVPVGALVEEQGNFSVFVQDTPESFVKRQVKIGQSDGKRVEIISGLKASERLVIKGGILVKLAAVSNSLDPHAGHVH